MPIVAARFKLDSRQGPWWWFPEDLHSMIYITAHEMFHPDDGKPRIGIGERRGWLYRQK